MQVGNSPSGGLDLRFGPVLTVAQDHPWSTVNLYSSDSQPVGHDFYEGQGTLS